MPPPSSDIRKQDMKAIWRRVDGLGTQGWDVAQDAASLCAPSAGRGCTSQPCLPHTHRHGRGRTQTGGLHRCEGSQRLPRSHSLLRMKEDGQERASQKGAARDWCASWGGLRPLVHCLPLESNVGRRERSADFCDSVVHGAG